MADIAAWHAELKSVAAQDPEDGIHPAFVMQQLRAVLGAKDIVAADTGASAAWTGALYPSAAGRNYFRSAGSLGWVFPGGLGVALANPDVRTVAVTGDGGMCYHIGDLETAVRLQIPLLVVVLNNCCFASEYHSQKHKWKHVVHSVTDFVDIPYSEIARAFGAYGARVIDKYDIESELQKALATAGPSLIEIMISKEVFAPRDGDAERRV